MDTADISDPNGPLLAIVTTQTAAKDSAAWFLRPGDEHNPDEALKGHWRQMLRGDIIGPAFAISI